MTYKDKTWCPFGVLCGRCHRLDCGRILTDDDVAEIERTGAMVSWYADMPDCFEPWFVPEAGETDKPSTLIDKCAEFEKAKEAE